MLDWLRRAPSEEPVIDLGGRVLPVVIRRLAHAKRMTLRLAPDGSAVRISIPRWGRTADALDFAARRRAWLAGQLDRLPAPVPAEPDGTMAFRGEAFRIAHDPAASRRPTLEGAIVRIGGPAESLSTRLRRWLEAEARRELTADLDYYCAQIDRAPPKLALSNARRRWGSCAADGAIRINWRLIMAPDAVRRSVVAHEVAHLVHFDHSPRFHALLAQIYEHDIGEADRWLKREGRSLYQPFG